MKVEDLPEGTLVADGFEDALVGVGWRVNTPIAIYDREKAIWIMAGRDGFNEQDAEEYISFNVEGAYVGEGTPIFVMFGDAETS